MQVTPDMSDVLKDAGARPCPKCGARALIPDGSSSDDEQSKAFRAPGGAPVWFCFECGHETARP
jgi:hypothetical protein